MKLLHVIGTLDPTYGGPVEGLTHLSLAEFDLGNQVEIVTLGEAETIVLHNNGIVIHALGPSIGKYRFNIRLISWLINNAKRFDVVICHGIWQYQGLAIWLASRFVKFHYFVFVHGALDPWFRYAYPYKHIKKWLYWLWAEYNVLKSAKAVLYTSEEEKLSAPKSFCLFKANGVVINYGIGTPEGDSKQQKKNFYDTYPTLQGKHILLFLSRIHPKKGCDILIEAFARIIKQDSEWHLVIAGPDQEGWQSILMQRAFQLGCDRRITWTGMLNGDLKWGAFHAADVFILPSHSENFGIVVAEALACGLPVLITDKVNIWREIIDDDAGLVEPDTPDGVVRLMQKWFLLSQDERQKMRINAQNCFFHRFEIKMTSQKFIKVIRTLIEVDTRI
jgi:glycosyltransferase involved in cell wall biosynthesis